MQRFKNILVLYDRKVGDEAALDRAAALALKNDAALTVVEAVESLPSDAVALFGPLALNEEELQRRFTDERMAHLERLVASLRQQGVTAKAMVLVGRPFLEVIRAVLRERYDLVVMTAEVWRGLRQITFGSTSMHLMRKCPCPVWVMQPKAGRRFRRILAAVDPDVTKDEPSPLDTKILQLASSLARMEQCRLDVLHAWDFKGADLDTSRSEITDAIKGQLIERNQAAHRAGVQRLLDGIDLQGLDFELHLPRGDPIVAIPRFARDKQVDLIVMGTIGRTGIAGFFIGDTAEVVLRQVECSILAVKPEGFVTPVATEA